MNLSFTHSATEETKPDKDDTPETTPQAIPELEEYSEDELDDLFARLEQPKA